MFDLIASGGSERGSGYYNGYGDGFGGNGYVGSGGGNDDGDGNGDNCFGNSRWRPEEGALCLI